MSLFDIFHLNCSLMNSATHSRSGWRQHFLSYICVVLPAVLADGWRIWLLLMIWTTGCSARLLHGDRQVFTDCCLFATSCMWLWRNELIDFAVKRRDEAHATANVDGSSTLYLALSVTTVLVSTVISFSFRRAERKSNRSAESPPTACEWTLDHPPARIFPCRTTHARMFPKKHAFGYSYLQCGYPVVPQATTTEGINISDGKDRTIGRWWMHVKADDYLDRGNGDLGFYGKLKMYLRQHVSAQVCKRHKYSQN